MDSYDIARIIALVIVWLCVPVNIWCLIKSRKLWKDGGKYFDEGFKYMQLAMEVHKELTKDKEAFEEWLKTRELPEDAIPLENEPLTSEEN